MRIWKTLVCTLIAAMLAGTALSELTEMNHYVVKADVRAYMTDEDLEFYKKAIDAILAREKEVRLSDDYEID